MNGMFLSAHFLHYISAFVSYINIRRGLVLLLSFSLFLQYAYHPFTHHCSHVITF